jgi:primosomal protein N' (replication factor Y)
MCHQCGTVYEVPATCPRCGSHYLRQIGKGTQAAEDELRTLLPPGTPVIRMDADTTTGKDGHERLLNEFIAAPTGVLLGTQMIAKGLDFPDVTLVGVLLADVALNLPDFRAAERTYSLLEQVAGRAGRAEKDGRVLVQTYWPQHVAIRAAAAHDRAILLASELATRKELGYPPYRRMANVLIWGKEDAAVQEQAMALRQALLAALPGDFELLGPSPCVISRRQGSYRWHIIVKSPAGAPLPQALAPVFQQRKTTPGVNVAVDVDPYDML